MVLYLYNATAAIDTLFILPIYSDIKINYTNLRETYNDCINRVDERRNPKEIL